MATANTGSAGTTNDSSDKLSKKLEEINKFTKEIDESLISANVQFQDQLSRVKELSKEYKEYKHNIERVGQIGTQVKYINEAILNITEGIGIRKIKEGELDKISRRISQESFKLENEKQAALAKQEAIKQKIAQIELDNNLEKNNLSDIEAKINQEKNKLADAAITATQKEKELIENTIKDLEKQHIQILENLKTRNDSLAIEKNSSTEAENLSNLITATITMLNKEKEALDKINGNLKEFNVQADKALRKSLLLNRTFQNLSRIPIIGPLLDIVDLSEKAEKGWQNAFSALRTQLKNIFTSQIALATMAIAAISKLYEYTKKIITQVLEFDKATTAVANNMAISREAARSMVYSFSVSSGAVNKLNGLLDSSFINITNISKAISSLQEGFGTSAAFSDQMVQSQILLTDQMGLAAEEAIEIQKFQLLAGVGAKEFLDNVTRQVSQQERLNKVSLSYRKVIAEVSKVSAEISASYKNNPKLLIEAVIQAQKLGMTLEQTRKISESLLNFESSIENELKAELLLGRSLNYEKARSLALDGKSAEAAAELIEQTGGLQGITKLNVIQRKALAESIGMSSEELVKAAQQEEILKKLGESSLSNLKERYDVLVKQGRMQEAQNLLTEIQKHENGEILAQDIAKTSLNQRFEQILNRVKEIFVGIGDGPIIKIAEYLADFLQNTGRLKTALMAVSIVATAIATALTTAAIASVIASGGLSLVGTGVALGVGALGGYALMNSLMPSSSTDVVEPSINPLSPVKSLNDAALSPKGDVMISTPEGNMFKVGERDYIYTTPVAPDQMMNATAGGAKTRGYDKNQVKDDESVSLLREMVSLLKNKGYVYMDSRIVGETLGQSTTSFG